MGDRQKPEDLLSRDQLEGMAEIWARPKIEPIFIHGKCQCGHHGTIDPRNGLCMWCQPKRPASERTHD